ncbi:hypothetical protein HRR83_001209 [Exophiala dermatitidis]|uniref:Uncharacterized protein n=1 Tax=Exophiala dermatitidis TaxID=5970 RepID=A0AAN6EZL2_EXODE|nr:hypothetical protein HRR74_001213 [Exophiala dermatitidis]KAJ4527034.1 hypothetical protein HRR73_001831 [Exophiala dermatitidis]KAJ4532751.1 hypothetical protein HRR76_007732 [Exophiala dermatitidis]KAJ4546737.1 hypothetical protein HRR77_004281 [Exophiala dermatitidis]KAJ4573895.1 hypothetical protein HRR79_002904 [Exophiala dermatitidis]
MSSSTFCQINLAVCTMKPAGYVPCSDLSNAPADGRICGTHAAQHSPHQSRLSVPCSAHYPVGGETIAVDGFEALSPRLIPGYAFMADIHHLFFSFLLERIQQDKGSSTYLILFYSTCATLLCPGIRRLPSAVRDRR